MSIQAVAWVLEDSKARGHARLVLISLANHHNKGTAQCNPGHRTIAREAGISTGSVSAQIKKLVELGEIEVLDPGTSHRPAFYRLSFDQQPIVDSRSLRSDPESLRPILPVSTSRSGESTSSPEPRRTVEPTQEPGTDCNPRLAQRLTTKAEKDALWDSLAAAFGPAIADVQQSFYGRIVRQLVQLNATPTEVNERAQVMFRKDWSDPGPAALVKHWHELGQPARPKAGPLGATVSLIEKERANGTR